MRRIPGPGQLDHGQGDRSAARAASIAAAGLFAALATFEAGLAAGLPMGSAAWGGREATLGVGLRVASGASAPLLGAAALVVLRRGGHRVWAPLPDRWLPQAGWILTGYTALGTLLNAASRSRVERAVMTPTALGLAVLCAIVAKGPSSRPVPLTARSIAASG